MISDRLETTGIGLVLDAVQLAVRAGVRISSGYDLLSLLGCDLAIVALLLVLDSVTGGVIKPIASIAVVHVLVPQDRDGGGAWLLEASLESTSGLATTCVRLRLLWLSGLLGIVATAKLTLSLTLASAQGSHRRISSLVAGLASRRQILIRGCSTELAILARSIQEIAITSTATAGTWGSRSSIKVIQAG